MRVMVHQADGALGGAKTDCRGSELSTTCRRGGHPHRAIMGGMRRGAS